MQNIDVFLDLESLGTSFDGILIDFVFENLEKALAKEHFVVAYLHGFARCRRGPEMMPPAMKTQLRRKFESHFWKMTWSGVIADLALIAEVENRLEQGKLSKAMLIGTNDKHFIPIISRVRDSGRTVIVAGQSMNKRLKAAADRSLSFWEMLGGHPYKVNTHNSHLFPVSQPVQNPIPLPQGLL